MQLDTSEQGQGVQPLRAIGSIMTKRIVVVLLTALLLAASACSTVTTTGSVSANKQSRWLLLPIDNLSSTPQAGEKAQSLLETHLRKRGVNQLETYIERDELSLLTLLNVQKQVRTATEWGRASGYRYGLTGTIHEWHYKSGPDKEPAVGISLKLVDLNSNEVLWQGTAAKTGWGYANLSAVANTTIDKLMKQVVLTSTQSR